MSRIRSKNNLNTEIALAKIFRANQIAGWRRNYPIFGHPDFVFPKKNTAVFVDGCFWHRCPKCNLIPVTNRKFWRDKLSTNVLRDNKVTRTLRHRGWVVIRLRECQLKQKQYVRAKLAKLGLSALQNE